MDKIQNIIKLASDMAKGRTITKGNLEFSAEDANDKLRKAFADYMDFSLDGTGVIDRKTFRKHKVEIFEILEVIINESLQEGLKNQFDGFAEYRNLAWGDENKFVVPEDQDYYIALISDGNGNLRRQRLRDGQSFKVDLDTYGIKIGEDFHRFLAGRVQWADLMKGIAVAFQKDLTQRIHDGVMASYGKYNAPYHRTGTLTEEQLIELTMHLKARTGEDSIVYGTKLALRKLAPSADMITDEMRNYRNKTGYYGEIAGIELREIEQSHKYGTDEWAIDNDMILVLPQNVDKMVKVVNEGDSIIQDLQGGVSADMMQEYFICNRFGISIITTKAFGFIKLTK